MSRSFAGSQFRCDNVQEMNELERLCGAMPESVKLDNVPKKDEAKEYLDRLVEFTDAVADCIPHDNKHADQWDTDDVLLWNVVCSMSNWSRSAIAAADGYIGVEDWSLINLATEIVYESIPHDIRVERAYDGLHNLVSGNRS